MEVEGEAEFHLSVLNYIMQELKLLFFFLFSCWGFPSVHQAEFLFFSLVTPWLSRNCLCNHISGHHWVLALKMHTWNSSFWVFLALLWQKEIPVANLVSGFWSPSFFGCSNVSDLFLKKDKLFEKFPYNSFLLYAVATWRGQLSLLSLPPSDADMEINLKMQLMKGFLNRQNPFFLALH